MNLLTLIHQIRRRILAEYHLSFLYWSDRKRFRQHAGAFHQSEREQKLAAITMAYHIIEKGLTMPNRRLGFGKAGILNLVRLLDEWARLETDTPPIFSHALSVLKAYRDLHTHEKFALDDEILEALNILHRYPTTEADEQLDITRESYFSKLDSSFPEFAASRHSVRHLSGSVSLEQIKDAITLANLAPSACNRQHTRVHCICSKETQEQILTLQNGSRGFGHLADKLLIITADLHDIRWMYERNDLYTNAGIYIMNLCYALHYYKVAHCILNWSVSPRTDTQLRKLVYMPDNESVVCMLVCGSVPETFRLASSPRKSVNEILRIH